MRINTLMRRKIFVGVLIMTKMESGFGFGNIMKINLNLLLKKFSNCKMSVTVKIVKTDGSTVTFLAAVVTNSMRFLTD